jgi:Kef-type K+ transport system membrane component KefB
MSGTPLIVFTVEIALMLACGIGCGYLMRRLHQPAVLGEMLGGIILGPTIFGALWPDAQSVLFPTTGAVAFARDGTIKLGMLFFLFMIGLDIDLGTLRRYGWNALCVGLMGTAAPLAVGAALVYLLPGVFEPLDGVQRWTLALFLGASLANSANPVLARILLDLGLLKDKLGAVLMTATVIDDLICWSLLAVTVGQTSGHAAAGIEGALVPSIGSSVLLGLATVFGFFLAMVALGRWVATPLLRRARKSLPWPAGFMGTAIVLLLGTAAAAEACGIHAFLGPFLLGLALAPTNAERREAYDVMNGFVFSFFVPIYFVSMGLTANFVGDFQFTLVAVIFIAACVSKIFSAYAGARMSGLDKKTSWAVGCGMNARGAVGIILAGIGLESGVIGRPTYVALVLMALVTSLMAGPMMKFFLASHEGASESLKEARA